MRLASSEMAGRPVWGLADSELHVAETATRARYPSLKSAEA